MKALELWADGGETRLDNLVQLCRHHHRLLHEGGFQCGKDEQGNLQLRDPRERPLNRYVLPTPVPHDATIEDWMVAHMKDVAIDDSTCIPNWMAGDTMDRDLAVGNIFLALRTIARQETLLVSRVPGIPGTNLARRGLTCHGSFHRYPRSRCGGRDIDGAARVHRRAAGTR